MHIINKSRVKTTASASHCDKLTLQQLVAGHFPGLLSAFQRQSTAAAAEEVETRRSLGQLQAAVMLFRGGDRSARFSSC